MLHDHQAELNLNPEQAKLLDVYYKQFVHAGAELPPAKQAQLKVINKRLSTLQIGIRPEAARRGQGRSAARHRCAGARRPVASSSLRPRRKPPRRRKMTGYVLPLQNTTQQPALESLTSHDTRQKLFDASLNRAEHGDANDTRAIVSELAQLRAKKAALFGAANFADYNLYDQMAKDRATAVGFLDRLAPAVSAKERQEWADIVGLAQVAGRELSADRGRLELLCRADPQAALRAQQRRAEALFRVQQGARRMASSMPPTSSTD